MMLKYLEKLAIKFLLKRGFQVTYPRVYFSENSRNYIYSKTEWKPKTT